MSHDYFSVDGWSSKYDVELKKVVMMEKIKRPRIKAKGETRVKHDTCVRISLKIRRPVKLNTIFPLFFSCST